MFGLTRRLQRLGSISLFAFVIRPSLQLEFQVVDHSMNCSTDISHEHILVCTVDDDAPQYPNVPL